MNNQVDMNMPVDTPCFSDSILTYLKKKNYNNPILRMMNFAHNEQDRLFDFYIIIVYLLSRC